MLPQGNTHPLKPTKWKSLNANLTPTIKTINTEIVKKSSSKGIAHLGLIIVILLIGTATLFYYFFRSGTLFQFVGETTGPPPSEHEARKAWFSENIVSMDRKMYILDEKLPTWNELDAMHQSLPQKRIYPNYIKATQTYNTTANLVEVLYFADVLQDMGINTQFVHANYWYRNGKFKLAYSGYEKPKVLSQDESKRALVHNILLAKQNGFAVVLFPDYYELENGGMNKLGITTDLEERLETIALEIAEIAEKYSVEYLVPVNQIEMIFESNDYDVAEAQSRTNAFYASIVPQIKQIYSGKIMYKMGGFGNWGNYDAISLEGADIFGFTSCNNANRNGIDFVTTDIKMSAEQANKLSEKYNVPWFNAEFVVSYDAMEGESINPNAPTIEEYYEAALEAFNTYGGNAVGFTIHSLLTTGKVYDTEAYPLIKSFFTSH